MRGITETVNWNADVNIVASHLICIVVHQVNVSLYALVDESNPGWIFRLTEKFSGSLSRRSTSFANESKWFCANM